MLHQDSNAMINSDEEPLLPSPKEDRPRVEFLPTSGPIDIWASYSTVNKTVVKSISYNLYLKHGIKCWDFENIPGGQPGWNCIGNATQRAKKLLLVYSKEYVKSRACQHEKDMAFNSLNEGQRLKILVVRLDDALVPPEVNALQSIQGKNKSPEAIAEELALAFNAGNIPQTTSHAPNGYSVVTRFPGPEGILRTFKGVSDMEDRVVQNVRSSCLMTTLTEEDLRIILQALSYIPPLQKHQKCCLCWVVLVSVLLTGSLFGILLGCTCGGFSTLIASDTWFGILRNSKFFIAACCIICPYAIAVTRFMQHKKDIQHLHLALRKVNSMIHPHRNLLLYIDDNITQLVFSYFIFTECKEELFAEFRHLLSKNQDSTLASTSDSEIVETAEDYVCHDSILWDYLVAYHRSRVKTNEFDGLSKHYVFGWKCLCQFIRESHATDLV